MIAMEDLHWADASTLEVLAQVIRELESAPLLVMATFRPVQPDSTALLSFAGSMRQLFGARRIDLGPIPATAAERLVRGAGTDLTDDAVQAIVRRGDGNPLFLEEAARDAARAAREGRPPPRVPTAIRELVQARVAALPERARNLAGALAVLGAPSSIERLCGLLGWTRDEVADGADRLVRQSLITVEDARLGFRHALTLDAVYESVPIARRQAWHLACVGLIESEEGDAGAADSARHLLAVGG
jgi:predicted ATPase